MLIPNKLLVKMYACHLQIPMATKYIFLLEKWTSSTLSLLTTSSITILYDTCLRNLSQGKSMGPDSILNDILKTLSCNFYNMMYLLFLKYYHKKDT